MYFLINDIDNSVNCASETPLPDFMVHHGLTRVTCVVDHLPQAEYTNPFRTAKENFMDYLHDCHYDPDTQTIIPNKLGLSRMSHTEHLEYVQQQIQINQAIEQSKSDKFDALVKILVQEFPGNPIVQEILSDGVVTQDELQQIESMLNK